MNLVPILPSNRPSHYRQTKRFRRVSNPGPSACQADVITTTPRSLRDELLTQDQYLQIIQLFLILKMINSFCLSSFLCLNTLCILCNTKILLINSIYIPRVPESNQIQNHTKWRIPFEKDSTYRHGWESFEAFLCRLFGIRRNKSQWSLVLDPHAPEIDN